MHCFWLNNTLHVWSSLLMQDIQASAKTDDEMQKVQSEFEQLFQGVDMTPILENDFKCTPAQFFALFLADEAKFSFGTLHDIESMRSRSDADERCVSAAVLLIHHPACLVTLCTRLD